MGLIDVVAGLTNRVVDHYVKSRERRNEDALNLGSRIAIRACDGKYVQTNLDNGTRLTARERHGQDWEAFEFEIVDPREPFSYATGRPVQYGDKVAFRSISNGRFVGVDYDTKKKEIVARVPWVQEWETFSFLPLPEKRLSKLDRIVRYGNFFALQACGEEYVMYDKDGDGLLSAVAQRIQAWEAFVAIEPSRPK